MKWKNLIAVFLFCLVTRISGESEHDLSQVEGGSAKSSIRNRRQMPTPFPPGGVRPEDVNSKDIQLFLKEALDEINAGEGPDYSVTEILEASYQSVQGDLYKFKVKVLVGGNTAICHFEVWEQGWIVDGRDVKVNCDNDKKYKLTQNPVYQRGKSKRSRRDALSPVPPGGVYQENVNHKDVQLYLREALEEINAGEEPDYSVKEVLEASYQVVQGFLWKFKVKLHVGGNDVICNFKVWERSWIPNGRDVKVNCDNTKTYNLTQNPVQQREKSGKSRRDILVRKRRQTSRKRLGGITPKDVNDEEVQLFLREALAEINAGEGPDYSVKEVLEASYQVVQGVLWRFKVKLLVEDNEVICHFKVWEQAWIPNGRDVKVDCDNTKTYNLTQNPVFQREKAKKSRRDILVRNRRQIPPIPPGGLFPKDVNDMELLLYLVEALDEINAGEEPDYTVKEVLEATSQVVAGVIWRFKAKLLVGGRDVICNFKITEQAWVVNGRDVEVNCDNDKKYKLTQNPVFQREKSKKSRRDALEDLARNRRQIPPIPPGGLFPKNVNDKEILLVLKDALDEINAGEEPDYSVKEVLEATSQVVAGIIWRFKAKLLVGGRDVICNFKITEQAWAANWRDVEVNCDNQKTYKLKQPPLYNQ